MGRLSGLPAILLILTISAVAQTSNQTIGEVTALDAKSGQLSLKTDKGEAVAVSTGEKTTFRRIPPGEKDLTKATRITLAEIGVGDRVLAIGPASGEARSVIVMSRTELTQMQQREQADWQKRGVSGSVSAIDPAAGAVTIKAGQKTIAIKPSDQTSYRRYAPDSVKFADATPSSLAEIKIGDQVRVLGDKSEDGSSVKAERIVFGSFRQIAGTIASISAEAGEIRITDLATKKPLIVRVNAGSAMRKLPPAAAAALARRYQPGATAGGDTPQMLDRLPAMQLAELKPGDAIMISSSSGPDPGRVTAIMLLAGVEPLLTASPAATRDIMGGWNLDSGSTGPSQ